MPCAALGGTIFMFKLLFLLLFGPFILLIKFIGAFTSILIFPLKLFGEIFSWGLTKMGRFLKFSLYMLAIPFLPFVWLYKLFALSDKSSKSKRKKGTRRRSPKTNYFGDDDNYFDDDASWVDELEEIDMALGDDD